MRVLNTVSIQFAFAPAEGFRVHGLGSRCEFQCSCFLSVGVPRFRDFRSGSG